MPVRKVNLVRLVSISAAGAGALSVAAGKAEAGTVSVYDLPSPVRVGWESGDLTAYIFSQPGAPTFHVKNVAYGNKTVRFTGGFYNTSVSYSSFYFRRARHAGKQLSTVISGGAFVATRALSWALGDSGGSHYYELFRFTGPVPYGTSPTSYHYGWVEFSAAVNLAFGPEVTIYRWAVDGVADEPLAAGDTGTSSVPEPSSFVLTGLAALALGASGLRRWRAARDKTA
jgi:hypothetical protein